MSLSEEAQIDLEGAEQPTFLSTSHSPQSLPSVGVCHSIRFLASAMHAQQRRHANYDYMQAHQVDAAHSIIAVFVSDSHSLPSLPVVPHLGQPPMLSLKHMALTRELVVFHQVSNDRAELSRKLNEQLALLEEEQHSKRKLRKKLGKRLEETEREVAQLQHKLEEK